MTPTEAAALLAIAAAFDNRKPDADAAQAWALALDGLRFEDCRDAIVAHFRVSSEWLMPAKVIAEVKRIRSKRITEFGPFDVPSGLNSIEYGEFLRVTRKRIADGDVTSPDELATPGLKRRNLADLKALMPRTDGAA